LVGTANSLVLLLVIAAAVLGPLLPRAAIALLAPLLLRTGVAGWLAAANSRAHAARTAAAVTPLILAVAFAATVVFTRTTQLDRSAEEIRSGTMADQVLTSVAGMSPELARRAAALPGMTAATPGSSVPRPWAWARCSVRKRPSPDARGPSSHTPCSMTR
jgi:putative ABC transport system permease protein